MKMRLHLATAVLLLLPAVPVAPGQVATGTISPAPDPAPAGSKIQLTLEQAEALALRNNPQISIARLQALQARESVREQRSALLPQASVNVTAVASDPGSRISAGSLSNSAIFPRIAAGAVLNQLITDFGRTRSLISSSEFQARAADENAAAAKQQVILAVDQAFYNALETGALQHVAEETVKTRQLLVDQVQALTRNKLKSDLDLSFSEVDLSRARILLLDSRSNYESAISILSAILGYPNSQEFALVEPYGQDVPPALDPNPLIQQALESRPEVVALQNEVLSAAKFSKAEHDLWWPTVTASGVVGAAPARDPTISSWYGAGGVNINLPLFNGYLFNARAKTADLETRAREQRLKDLQNNVARDVRNAWLDTQKSYQRLSLTQQLREQASLAVELAQARYKLGLGSIVEFSQANLQKTEADLEATDARYQYLVTEIILAFETGTSR